MKFSKTLITTLALLSLSASASASRKASVRTGANAVKQEEKQLQEQQEQEEPHDPFVQFLKGQEERNTLVKVLLGLRGEFRGWTEKFGREYQSMEEELERMMIWAENHEHITMHNSQTPKSSYTVAHNDFSDITNDEFQQRFSLGKYSPGVDAIRASQQKAKEATAMRKIHGLTEEGEAAQAEFRYLRQLSATKEANEESGAGFAGFFDDKWFDADDSTKPAATDDNDTDGLADSVDWVTAGAVTPVKNQGSCGSCWAFSATGSIEGAAFIKHGELVALSEQNLIDCDTVKDKGCSGGIMEDAFKFDETANGLCSEVDYPYLAEDGKTCNTNCTKVTGSHVTDYLDIAEKDKHGLIASLVLQPTSIAMQAGQLSFQFYSSGVFSDDSCGKRGNVDHGVLAVGYGTDDASGKTFFKVKNSWGDAWGEQGYFRIDRKSDNDWGTCAILMLMTAPIVE